MEVENSAHELLVPFNIRTGLVFWRELLFKSDWERGVQEVKGRYLVEALGHRAGCHTPRNFIGSLKLDE